MQIFFNVLTTKAIVSNIKKEKINHRPANHHLKKKSKIPKLLEQLLRPTESHYNRSRRPV